MYTQNVKYPLFRRRTDLSIQTRFLIAYIVCFQNKWGTVTRLSDKYNVSRTFIYDLRNYFLFMGENNSQLQQVIDKQTYKMDSLEAIFSLRFEGKSSIEVFLLS